MAHIRNATPRVAMTMTLATFVSLVTGKVVTSEQVLENSGFEQIQEDLPRGWRCEGPVSVCRPGRSGEYGVALRRQARAFQCFALERGFLYRGAVWARGKGYLILSFYEYKDGPGQGYVNAVNSESVRVHDEWQKFQFLYSQGTNEAHLKGLCFALAVGKEDAEVLIDDAAVDKVSVEGLQHNLLQNPEFADIDADGLPDNWKIEKRRACLETGPERVTILKIACTLFSEDYVPAADFADWWLWSRWGAQHGSGWPALPRPLGGAYTVLLESHPISVEPGVRYDVRMSLRELEVWGEFVAVRWFDADKKPLAEFEERIAYHHIHGGHTGDWVDYTGRVTSSQRARYATVVVGCKQSSGAIWIARPSLMLGLGAPTRNEPRYERNVSRLKQGLPRVIAGKCSNARVAISHQVGVQESPSKIRIGLANGVNVELPLSDGKLVGITMVSCDGKPLRSPKSFPLAPVIETVPTREYTACVYEGWDKLGDGFMIRSSLQTQKGEKDRLYWLLHPKFCVLGGERYKGLSYGYRFVSESVRARRIMDRATWEVGGSSQGLRVGKSQHSIGPCSTYCLETAYRFACGESFDYETGSKGTLVSYLDRYHTTLLARAATPDFVILQDTFLFADMKDAQTTTKNVLFRPTPGGADDWARIRDELYARFQEQFGAPPETPLEPAAMFIGYGGLRGIGDLRPDDPNIKQVEYYQWVAKNAVPRLADLGFKRIMMVLPRGPWNWPENDINNLCPNYAEPFKTLCDEAHKHGMTVISWYGTVQNLDGAAVWKEHPECILWAPNGQRTPTYFSPWGWPGKLEAGFAAYTLNGLKVARDRTGLAGLWLDSYSSATHLMDTADFGDAVRQADGLLGWHAAVEKMGYYTYCEGAPHAIGTMSESGWQPPEDWSRFVPETLYKHAPYLQQPWDKSRRPHGISEMGCFLADPERRHYYRMLANLCCPIVDMGHFGTDAEAMTRIAQANHDFNAVADLMHVRKLLANKAVEWKSNAGHAVFVFQDMLYSVPKGCNVVRDVTAGRNIPIPSNRQIHLRKYHTYRFTP